MSVSFLRGSLPLPGPAMRAACLCLLAFAPCVAHADRAVIIGVGSYLHTQDAPNLPGIDRDVENARTILAALGFRAGPEELHVLQNSEATAAAIQAELRWALAAGPNQRAIIYFSGHGTHVLDDKDKTRHSSLVAYDYTPDGKGHASGAVLGNWIGSQLDHMSAGVAYLLVDACESGTITRAYVAPIQGQWRSAGGRALQSVRLKYLKTPGVPDSLPAEPLSGMAAVGSGHWVAMTAVLEHQYAQATDVGSTFTLGLLGTLSRVGAAQMTPVQLRDAVASNLLALNVSIDAGPAGSNPQVFGPDHVLLDTPFVRPKPAHPLPPTVEAHAAPPLPGKVWSQLQLLVAHNPGTVRISGVKTRYAVHDPLTLTLEVKRTGYLSLVSVDLATDQVEVLVPNTLQRSPIQLKPGNYLIPDALTKLSGGKRMPMEATSTGDTLLVAILSPAPIAAFKPGAQVDVEALQRLDGPVQGKGKGQSKSKGPPVLRNFATLVGDAEAQQSKVTRIEAVSAQMVIE